MIVFINKAQDKVFVVKNKFPTTEAYLAFFKNRGLNYLDWEIAYGGDLTLGDSEIISISLDFPHYGETQLKVEHEG